MAFGNNRAAERSKASFIQAGGSTMLFRHPLLAGQVEDSGVVDQIDVSSCVKLNETFLEAAPMMDNSTMEVLVDGSTITITNHILAGSVTLQVLPTTGLVGTGDFVAAAHLIMASGDSVGGTFTVVRELNGKKIATIFYGTSFKNVPHLKIAGNAVVTYPIVMNYAGWVQTVTNADVSMKTIWAVGNKYGLKGIYRQYGLNEGGDGTPLTSVDGVGDDQKYWDSPDGDALLDNAKVPSPPLPNVRNATRHELEGWESDSGSGGGDGGDGGDGGP